MNDYLETKELYHHGVKGMKWGIIKEDYQMHKRAKNTKKEGTAKGAVIGGLLGTATGFGIQYILGKGHVFSNKDGMLTDIYTGEDYFDVYKRNTRRTLGLAFLGSYMGRKIGKYNASKKASEENLKDIRYQNLSDRQKSQLIKNNVLGHSGIKGQKWGIRRYQNEDGSLTEEGKKRYGKTEENFDKKEKQNTSNKNNKQEKFEKREKQNTSNKNNKQEKFEKREDESKKEPDSPSAVKVASDVAKDASNIAKTAASAIDTSNGTLAIRKSYPELTNKELQDRIQRLNLERTYGDLSGDTKYVKTGKEKTREILQTLGATLAITSTALGIYEMLRKNFFRKTATGAVKDIVKN